MCRVPLRGRCANWKNLVLTMKFVLKQYDTELISFGLRLEGLDGFVCTRHTGRRGGVRIMDTPDEGGRHPRSRCLRQDPHAVFRLVLRGACRGIHDRPPAQTAPEADRLPFHPNLNRRKRQKRLRSALRWSLWQRFDCRSADWHSSLSA